MDKLNCLETKFKPVKVGIHEVNTEIKFFFWPYLLTYAANTADRNTDSSTTMAVLCKMQGVAHCRWSNLPGMLKFHEKTAIEILTVSISNELHVVLKLLCL